MKRLFLLLVVVGSFTSEAATQLIFRAKNITLSPPWSYSNSSDSPDGGWVAPWKTANTVTGTIDLGQKLPAGSYKVFVKCADYDRGNTFTYVLGDAASSSETLDDRDSNTYRWSMGKVVTTTTPASQITFTFDRATTPTQPLRWMETYITSDTNEMVLRDDRVVTFHYPTSVDYNLSAALPGNRFPNSSFECGIGANWVLRRSGGHRLERPEDLWTSAAAHSGSYSMRLPCPSDGSIYFAQSKPINLASNKTHTISVWVKTSSSTAYAWIRLYSMYGAPSGMMASYTTNAGITATTRWQRMSVTAPNLPYYPNGEYYVQLETSKKGPGVDVYFDDIQVEEGAKATKWASMYPFEFDVQPSEPTRVFWTTESPTLTIRAFNNDASATIKTINYKFLDWTNGTAISSTVAVSAHANSGATATVTLDTNKLGHLRGWFWLTNQQSDTELTWVMTDRPLVSGIDVDSYAGAHISPTTNNIAMTKRLGLHWNRALSVSRMLWSEIEATEGVFTYPTDHSIYTNNGIMLMGNLGTASPAWLKPKSNITNYFGRMVSNVVTHYLGSVQAYEIWNEPNQGNEMPAVNRLLYYTEVLRIGATMIKAIDPNIQVVGGGGVASAANLDTIKAALGRDTNKIDFWSVHLYPPNESGAGGIKSSYVDHGWEVWNTEAGPVDKSGFTGPRSNFRTAGNYIVGWKGADSFYDGFYGNFLHLSRNMFTCMGNGMTKYFYYDAGHRNISVDDFTSRGWTLMDLDDSSKPKGAALAAIFRRIDKSAGQGVVRINGCTAFGFVRSSVPLVAIWSTTNKTVTLSGVTTNQLKIYDIVGNSATPSSLAIPVTKMPIMVEGVGIDWATLSGAFTRGRTGNRADTQAPSLAITFGLRIAPRAGVLAHFRWFAIDDGGTPTEGDNDLIQYRYRVNGGSWTEWSGGTWLNTATMPTSLEVQARDLSGNVSEDSFSMTSITNNGAAPTGGARTSE